MKILGFNYDKINIERLKDLAEDFKINTHIDILDIKEISTGILKTKEQVIQLKFVYKITYDPGFAVIDLTGHFLLTLDDEHKNLLKDWKKKNLSENFRTAMFNTIMRKASVKALELEDEMNLPLHMPFPVLKLDNKEK